jgi:hypothetical protein
MERWHRAFAQSDATFKELFGVKKEIFKKMLDVLTDAREKRRRKGGPRPTLSVGDQLLLTLQYWREYRTMAHLAYDYGIAKSTVRTCPEITFTNVFFNAKTAKVAKNAKKIFCCFFALLFRLFRSVRIKKRNFQRSIAVQL